MAEEHLRVEDFVKSHALIEPNWIKQHEKNLITQNENKAAAASSVPSTTSLHFNTTDTQTFKAAGVSLKAPSSMFKRALHDTMHNNLPLLHPPNSHSKSADFKVSMNICTRHAAQQVQAMLLPQPHPVAPGQTPIFTSSLFDSSLKSDTWYQPYLSTAVPRHKVLDVITDQLLLSYNRALLLQEKEDISMEPLEEVVIMNLKAGDQGLNQSTKQRLGSGVLLKAVSAGLNMDLADLMNCVGRVNNNSSSVQLNLLSDDSAVHQEWSDSLKVSFVCNCSTQIELRELEV
jgi:hypothetical protein